jgi:sugar lactone lactonase YvrE
MSKVIRTTLLITTLIVLAPVAGAIDKAATSANAAQPWLLTGIVSSSGKPMAGITVSAKVSGGPVTVSVFTDAQGRYYFPPLAAGGSYVVVAQAVGYERATSQLSLTPGINHANLSLKTTKDFVHQLSGWQQLAGLPENTREDRRGKAMLIKSCSECHQTARIFARRFDKHGWLAMADAMGPLGGGPPRGALPQNYATYREEVTTYLARVAGPGPSPIKLNAETRPTGDAVHAVVYEYLIPNADGRYPLMTGSNWSEGPPITTAVGTSIHDATGDLDGNVWFSTTGFLPGRTVGRLNGMTGELTAFPSPGPTPGPRGFSHAIVTSKDGLVWFNNGRPPNPLRGDLGVIDPRTGKAESYAVPQEMPGVGGWINEDGAGGIWASTGTTKGGEGALRFDRKTKRFEQFKSLSQGFTYGVAGDREGNGWWSQINSDIICHVDRKTGKVWELKLPFTWGGAPFLKPGDMTKEEFLKITVGIQGFQGNTQMPRRLKADLNADAVWIGNWSGNNLMRIDTKTKEFKFFPAPAAGMSPYDVGIDSSHRVWVGLQNGDEVARFDPDTEKWTIYPLPTKGVSPRNLMLVEREGHIEILLPANDAHKVVRLLPRTAEDAAGLKKRYYSAVLKAST